MIEIIAQCIGFLGLLTNILSVQFKDRKVLLIFGVITCIFMAIHFAMLGAYTAATLFAVAIFRALLFMKYDDGENRPSWPLYLMLVLLVGAGFATWQSWVSLLPITSTIFVTIGLWQIDTQRTRKLLIVGPILWMAHNAIVGSIAGFLNELMSFISIAVGLVRHRKRDLANMQEAADTTP